MGPTNVALVKLFEADRKLRDAVAKLESASHNVRIQERRVNDLTEKLRVGQHTHKEQQAKAGQFELEITARDQQIEKLRTQQQAAKNNKEYQAHLIEINTRKVDRGKIEEQAMANLEAIEKQKTEVTALAAHLETEKAKLVEMKGQIGDTLTDLQKEIDAIKPEREAAEATVPAKARDLFNRLADRYDGEAMAGIDRPDRRKEEYLCTSCNMELVRDIYNKLNSRNDVVFCPNCQRMLFIPDHFTAEHAIGGPGKTPTTKKKTTVRVSKTASKKRAASSSSSDAGEAAAGDEVVVVIEARAMGELGKALALAQGESVSRAVKADTTPVECEVHVDGKLAGMYKGISVENLERAIKYFMGERHLSTDDIVVKGIATEEAPAEAAAAPVEMPLPEPAAASPALEVASPAPVEQTASAAEAETAAAAEEVATVPESTPAV